MEAVTTLPRGLPLTRDDLDSMPDDGRRYELIDGVLIVSPAPTWRHQAVLGQLHLFLAARCPADLRLLFAPVDVTLADDTVMQPDLLVARRSDFGSRDLPTAPLLAVEVLSPSTGRFDRTVKRDRLEAAGCAAYWVIDPAELTLTAWELRDAAFVQVAEVASGETFRTRVPFALELDPADLSD